MVDKNLAESLRLMFGHEGGYSNHKSDPGGPTKYGVTHRTLAAHRGVPSVTAAEVKALTLEEATQVYKRSYWKQSGGSLLPSGLDYAAFDYGVNSGPARAIKSLQKVIGVDQDGIVGGKTVDAANKYHGGVEGLIIDYCNERMRFLRGLRTWSKFGRGWTIRVLGTDPTGQYKPELGVVGNALRMARSKNTVPSATVEGEAKGRTEDTSLTEIVKKPEAWAPLGGLLSALASIFSGDGPLQYALAFGVVVGVGIGVYYFVRRVRTSD